MGIALNFVFCLKKKKIGSPDPGTSCSLIARQKKKKLGVAVGGVEHTERLHLTPSQLLPCQRRYVDFHLALRFA
jgi:hypothetical protein